MNIGFETVGNATIICHDKKAILVTDPWLSGGAYFDSWYCSHIIPERQMKAIENCEYVWVSHGHPDHLHGPSLKKLIEKKVLLPNHAGARIHDDLKAMGFNVQKMEDRKWYRLSDNIQALCIADYNQDAILLINVGGKLIININDANDHGWGSFVIKTSRAFDISFLLFLTGYGDADMINYFDESGNRILPLAAKKIPFGKNIALRAEAYGASYVIPFSSMHRYQRKDSIWANEYTTPLEDYSIGFQSKQCELLPAFIRYDCENNSYETIDPPKTKQNLLDPEEIGDSWNEPLDTTDFKKINNYFEPVELLNSTIGFINFRIAGKDHRLELNKKLFNRGITFEVPRNSLMKAIEYEIFDDLLIGNFMKTTLHGKWGSGKLYPDFNPYLPKYADNGKARSKKEIEAYFKEYKRRAAFDFIRHRIEERSRRLLRELIPMDTVFYKNARTVYYRARKFF